MIKKVENHAAIDVQGVKYTVDRFGVVHQQPPYDPFTYDVKYVEDRYSGIRVSTKGTE